MRGPRKGLEGNPFGLGIGPLRPASRWGSILNRLQATAVQFEDLCARILAAAGFDVEREVRAQVEGNLLSIDARATRDRQVHLVEFKWTRLDPIPLRLLRDWAARITIYRLSFPGAKLALVVSGEVEDAHRSWILQQFGVEVWDRNSLRALAQTSPLLVRELDAIQADTRVLEEERSAKSSAVGEASTPEQTVEQEQPNPPGEPTGEALIKRLQDIRPGRSGAKAYERVCVDIVDYLFGEHLVDARPQSRTEDGLHVMDVVYRVRPQHSFWNTLTRDFRARVVLFEFKNYSAAVKPQQVYTTERYMSAAAMRPVCFLMTRLPPHEHAQLAAVGAMRESGKLLIFLSDADVETMLRFRDAEVAASNAGHRVDDDPTVVLDQKIYQFLATMAR